MNEIIDRSAKIIWDYHHLHHRLKKADAILVLGSHDYRVADYAADLFLKGYTPWLIFSGGIGRLTKDVFDKPEAEIFVGIALKKGVPISKIIVENKSTNTGENIKFTKKLLTEKGLDFQSFIVVQTPYMERRAYATFKKVWPEKNCLVTSPPIEYEDYPNSEISRDRVINIMVGDLQRIKLYPAQGYQIYQSIPKSVWQAYEKLIQLGYNKELIK